MSKSKIFAAFAASILSTATARQFVQYTPGGDDTLVERSDPILNPGSVAQHVHQIFGAGGFSPETSYDSLQQSQCTTVGAADGSGNAADKSIYWHPALYMKSTTNTSYVKIPTSGHKIYYRDFGSSQDKLADPFEFPKGFRMVAGNSLMRAADPDTQRQNITQWICHSSSSTNQGTSGGFPEAVSDCDAYPGFNGAIHFPHCWNSNDFDQTKPFAHVVYPDGDIEHGACPSSHPTRLPHIFMENQFDLHSVVDHVQPNSFVLAQGDSTGYGWHADFFNGWDEGAIPELIDTCPAPYYGNENIGTCPSYKKFATSAKDCKLKLNYQENVQDPGAMLPGCNPISAVNPAPLLAAAPLGVTTVQCGLSESSDSGTSASSASAPPPRLPQTPRLR